MTPCPFCGHKNLPGDDRCKHCLHSLMQKSLPHTRRRGDAFQDALLNEPVSELLTVRWNRWLGYTPKELAQTHPSPIHLLGL
jgi:hypothetical protein